MAKRYITHKEAETMMNEKLKDYEKNKESALMNTLKSINDRFTLIFENLRTNNNLSIAAIVLILVTAAIKIIWK